nr:hypothetical protein [Tanacetum cinerariifolium]
MDQQNPTLAKILILDTGKSEQWQFRIQLYLQHEHYALWEVIEFGDSYEAPTTDAAIVLASKETTSKKGRTVALTTEDMQKRKNDVKARTTLLLALPDEHQLRFTKNSSGKVDVNTSSIPTASTNFSLASVNIGAILEEDREEDFIQGTDVAGFDKSKVECFNCHKMGHFQGSAGLLEAKTREGETTTDKEKDHALVTDEEDPTEFSLMAKTSAESETGLIEFADDTITDYTRPSPSVESNPNDLQNSNSSASENGESTGGILSKPEIKFVRPADSPTVVKTHKKETGRKSTVKYAELYKKPSKKSTACYNCGGVDHLSYNCGKWVDHGRSWAKNNNTHKSMSPRPAIYRPYRPPMRPVRPNMNVAQPKMTSFHKLAHSYIKRPFQRTSAGNSQNHIDDKGYWDSGCSRHMTGNISYLSDYEPFDGGYVSFGQGGCKITGKGTIKTGKLEFENMYFAKDLKYNLFSVSQICDNKNSVLFTDSECIMLGRDFKLTDDTNMLLRTPRQHNIYSIDLNNIVPHCDNPSNSALRVNSPSFSRRIVPLFDSMLLPPGEGSGTPTEPHHTPSPEAPQTSHTPLSSPTLPPVTTVTTTPIPTVTLSDTPHLSQGEACPTASGFVAEQDRANIAKTSTLPYESTSRVTSLAADEGSMQQKLDELTALCTSLQRQHKEMVLEIAELKAMVKFLEDREGGGLTHSGDDAPIKRKKLDEGEAAAERLSSDTEEIRLDEGEATAERVSNDTEEMETVLTSMDATSVLSSRGVQVVPTAAAVATATVSIPTGSRVVPTASPIIPTAAPIFATATTHKASCKTKLVNSVTKPLHTLHMDLFGPTSELRAKIIRCDNRGEFKNKEMNDFCSRKGIKREFSNARTPQQNRVAERRNKTLIEVARTMLADAKLPVTFWAEAVNTACYVQNRVLVNKSQNNTPYELFNGRTPTIGFLKPFGYHVMILNTLDNLGKFEAKGDEGYFIGYKFYYFSGIKEATSQDVKKDVSSLRYIVLPNWFHETHLESSSSNAQDTCKVDAFESNGNFNPTGTSTNLLTDHMETLAVETLIPTVSSLVLTACLNDSPEPLSDTRLISKRVTSQDDMPSLDNILTLTNRFEDILRVTTNTNDTNRVEADLGNMETTISASPTPTLKIHKDHLKSQIIGFVDTPIQTRNKSKEMEEQSFIATIHQKTNPALLQFFLFSCFLSQVEPKKIFDALQDPSWVEAMQEELL